jgi:hypothetical protein
MEGGVQMKFFFEVAIGVVSSVVADIIGQLIQRWTKKKGPLSQK